MKKIIALSCLIWSCFFFSFAQNRSDSLHIEHYNLHLTFTDFSSHVVYGSADLTAVAKVNGLSRIGLDLKNMTVDSVWLNATPTTNFSHIQELLNIDLQNSVNLNDTLQITVFYHGVPATDSYFGGFYFSGEYCYNLGVAFRDLPHNFGRAWYPCLDFFTDRSSYDFYIETENSKRAICGGNLVDSTATSNETIIWHWSLEETVPTYLTSVAVGNYAHYTDTVHGMTGVVPIDIYTYPQHYDRVAGTFSHLKDAFHIYEMRYGPYRWNRVGYVGVNFNGGAMEHATNIAYPNFAITGNGTYESLYMHELSHHWFGDLITCHQAEEMWINEAFGNYSEFVAAEILYPSSNPETDGYAAGIRNQHRSVLKKAHVDDGGYWALDQMPQEVTYGTTTYDKGGITVHTLRKYMGDSIFFESIKALLTEYEYQDITSVQFFDFLSQYSGQNLHDFYDAWIHQPGFLHFSIDSIRSTGTANEYRFYVRQRLNHALHFANSNRLDITFVSSDRQFFTLEHFAFDGELADGIVQLPFAPAFAIADYHEKMADAVVDYNLTVSGTGVKSANEANIKMSVDALADTTFVRIEDNYVAPDELHTPNPNVQMISPSHYWRIECAPEHSITGSIRFGCKGGSSNIDYELANGHTLNELMMLYRRDVSEDWQIIPVTRSGNANLHTSYLVVDSVRSGEYAFAIGTDPVKISNPDAGSYFDIYPNPAKHFFNIVLQNYDRKLSYSGAVYDMNGKQIKSFFVRDSKTKLNTSDWESGVYVVKIFADNQLVAAKKVSVIASH